jgi:hypothetical protein
MFRAVRVRALLEYLVGREAKMIHEHRTVELLVEEQLAPERVDVGFDGVLDGVPHAASSSSDNSHETAKAANTSGQLAAGLTAGEL